MAESGHGHGINRRNFVGGVVALLGSIIAAVIGLPAIGYLLSPALKKTASSATDEWVPLGPVQDIPEDQPKLYTFTRTQQVGWERTASSFGVYVIKRPAGMLDVFSNVCTHLSCRVSWQEDQEEFICPCHDGRFAKDGAIVSGPQPRPLDRFEYKIEDGTLMVQVMEV
jgi:menaquinol-cytochrome c reductase iron-sulfur subunit